MRAIKKQFIEVTGFVKPSGFDLDGSLIAVSIETQARQKYLVKDNKVGDMLLKCVGKKLFVEGYLQYDFDLNLIEVTNYMVLSK